ncbi:MAG: helix-turn-helix domain-containing protein [Lachnospiraceae bacterium]|nr:helix-turn-helix domain-containing protein [Lachnospiraceae bacterium]
MTVNDRVKEIRKSEKLTLEKFGEKIGVSKGAISKIELGNRNVTDQMVKSICREFGYREEWLRDGIEPKQPERLDEDELAEYIEDLLSTENPTYTLIKSILKTYSKLDDKSKQVINDTIDKLISEIKSEIKKEG